MVVETAAEELFPDEQSDPKDWCLSPRSSDTEGDLSSVVSGSSASCLTPRSQLLKAKLAQMREQRLKDLRNRTPQSKLLREKMAELQFKTPEDAPMEKEDPSTTSNSSQSHSVPSKTPTDAPEERQDIEGDDCDGIESEEGSGEHSLAGDTQATEDLPKDQEVEETEKPLENDVVEAREVEQENSVAHTILEEICELAKNIEEISIGEEIEVIRMENLAQEAEAGTEEASHSELLDEEAEEVSEEITEEQEHTETVEETSETVEEEEEDRTEEFTEGADEQEISETILEEDVISETEEMLILQKLAGYRGKQRENGRNTSSSRHSERSQSPMRNRSSTHRSKEYHGERQAISKERKEKQGERTADRVRHSRDKERRNVELNRKDRNQKDRSSQRESQNHNSRERRESHSSPQEVSPRQHRGRRQSTKRHKSSSHPLPYEHQVELTLDTRRSYNTQSRSIHATPYPPDSERSSEEHMFLQIEAEELNHRNTNRYENHHQAIDDAMNSSDIFLPDFATTQQTDLIHSANHTRTPVLWTPLQRRHSHQQQQQQRPQPLPQTNPTSPLQDPSDVTALAAAASAAEQAAKAAAVAGAALACLKKSKAHQRDPNLAVAMAAAASASAAAATAAAAVAASLQPESTNTNKLLPNQDVHTKSPFEAIPGENLYY
jgi:hypothetical protein